MAPEQLSGETVDARADQFAYCVVAWECLYGARPFTGNTLAALLVAIERGAPAAPKELAVPDRVRAVLARGLALEPAARFADVPELLAALRTAAAPRTRRRLAVAAIGLAAAAGGAYFGLHALSAQRHAAACVARGESIRGLAGAAALAPVHTAFIATHAPNAQSAFDHTASVLGRTADALALQAVGTCRGRDEPERMTAARERCIADHERELSTLVDVLAHADADAGTVERAPTAAWGIYDPAPCDDSRTLLGGVAATAPPSPADAATLARAHALLGAGRYHDGVALVQPLADAARARHDDALELSALTALAMLRIEIDPPAEVRPILERRLALAEAQGQDLAAALALDELANLTGTAEKQHAPAHHWLELARAKLERLGGTNDALRGSLASTEAQILVDEGKYAEAETSARAAIASLAHAFGEDHPKVGSVYGTLTEVLLAQDKATDALDAGTHAYAILSAALGEDHPTVAQCLLSLKRLDEARVRLVRAGAVFEKQFGTAHPSHAAIYGNLGELEQLGEHWDAALADYRIALATIEQLAGPDSADASGARRDIARTLALAGRLDDARAEQLRAIAIVEKLGADGASRLAEAREELKQIEAALKK